MVYTIPKYTQYQLSRMVKMKLNKRNLSVDEASMEYSVDKDLLDDVLNGHVKFKVSHYEVVSLILKYTIDELLEDEVVNPISYRSEHKRSDQEINREIEKIGGFFTEVALLKKLVV